MLLNGNTSVGAFFNFMVVVFCIVLCFFAFYMDVFCDGALSIVVMDCLALVCIV